MEQLLRTALDALAEALYTLPTLLSQSVFDAASRLAQYSPDMLLFAVTFGIGTYFFSASFPRVLAFLQNQLPEETQRRLEGLGRDLKGSFSGLLRSQLWLMGLTFLELLLAFLLLRVQNPAALAVVTALVDALPVFGTGTVLLPWALYCLLLGESGRAMGLALTWIAVNLVRSAAQAKLLGDQIGLDPLASLIAVYVGWKLGHVWGMLLCPLALVTLQQLNDKGVLHLWRG
jgi:sporulation integral membrane protein YtvI